MILTVHTDHQFHTDMVILRYTWARAPWYTRRDHGWHYGGWIFLWQSRP